VLVVVVVIGVVVPQVRGAGFGPVPHGGETSVDSSQRFVRVLKTEPLGQLRSASIPSLQKTKLEH